jgi:hypothetical protein
VLGGWVGGGDGTFLAVARWSSESWRSWRPWLIFVDFYTVKKLGCGWWGEFGRDDAEHRSV